MYKGKVGQMTIFGEVEFIDTETYTKKNSKRDEYIYVSGKYKVVGNEDIIDLTLEFFNKDLARHKIN